MSINKEIEYAVLDPSKNITILVTSDVDKSDYTFVAKKLLELEPSAEQLGFLEDDKECDIVLNMAAGEFCGNATMSAAVYYGIKNNVTCGNVSVKSSGADKQVKVEIKKIEEGAEWEGIVEMPRPIKIQEVDFGNAEKFPVVFFKGIAHIIIDKKITSEKDVILKEYENKIKTWCEFLKVEALGIMFCDFGDLISMLPLVYVKAIDTLYLESSCASGTTAVGAYLTDKNKKAINIDIKQTSGVSLNIKSCEDGSLLLKGKVALLYKKKVKI